MNRWKSLFRVLTQYLVAVVERLAPTHVVSWDSDEKPGARREASVSGVRRLHE